MKRLGIETQHAKGIRIPVLRKIAGEAGKNHLLAERLWITGIHEARILATMVEEPRRVSRTQLDVWLAAINSWDLCDQLCMNLMPYVPQAHESAKNWSTREPVFEKRAGFVTYAMLAQKVKNLPDRIFIDFLPFIVQEATDGRKYVENAVIWAMKRIARRNHRLSEEIDLRLQILESGTSKAAGRVARAVRTELSRV